MGSARPARRFDAHRVPEDGPSRPAFAVRAPFVRFRVPSEACHCASAPLARSCDRIVATLSSLDFVTVRHLPGRWTRVSRGFPTLSRAASGVLTPIATYTTVPPGALRHRSVHRLHSSRRSPRDERTSSRTSRPSWRSSRRFGRFSGKRSDAGDFRASFSARIRSVHRTRHGVNRAETDASMPPRVCPPSSVLPPRPGVALWSRALPVHDEFGRRLDRLASSGLADHGDRFAPLGATGSYGVHHLATVADSFRPARKASS
jgi:hypothetical protein